MVLGWSTGAGVRPDGMVVLQVDLQSCGTLSTTILQVLKNQANWTRFDPDMSTGPGLHVPGLPSGSAEWPTYPGT